MKNRYLIIMTILLIVRLMAQLIRHWPAVWK